MRVFISIAKDEILKCTVCSENGDKAKRMLKRMGFPSHLFLVFFADFLIAARVITECPF